MKKLLEWLDFRIYIWSMRPAPKSPEGKAWVAGAMWGAESILNHLEPEVKAAQEALDSLDNYGVRFHHHKDIEAIQALLTKLTEVTDEPREHLRNGEAGDGSSGEHG